MQKIRVTHEILNYCRRELENGSLGMRGEYDGNYEEQLTGIVGECVMADLLRANRPKVNGKPFPDYDFFHNNNKIEIKTKGRTVDPVPEYACNIKVSQLKFSKADIYIFCSLNKKTLDLTICGWIKADEVEKKSILRKKGDIIERSDGTKFPSGSDFLELKISDLNKWGDYKK